MCNKNKPKKLKRKGKEKKFNILKKFKKEEMYEFLFKIYGNRQKNKNKTTAMLSTLGASDRQGDVDEAKNE